MYVCMCICLFTFVLVCVCVYVFVCTSIYIYIYIYIACVCVYVCVSPHRENSFCQRFWKLYTHCFYKNQGPQKWHGTVEANLEFAIPFAESETPND